MVRPALVSTFVLKTRDGKAQAVFVPLHLVGKVCGDELLINDGQVLLRDSEALDLRLLEKETHDAVLVDGQGQVEGLRDGAIGSRCQVKLSLNLPVSSTNLNRVGVDRVVDISLGTQLWMVLEGSEPVTEWLLHAVGLGIVHNGILLVVKELLSSDLGGHICY